MIQRLTFVYQAAKSTSFLTPIAICTAPSIFASSFSLVAGFDVATGGAVDDAIVEKSMT